MINVIDHGTGNITSVSNLLERINAQHIFTSDPVSLEDASHIIIPGVGHFASAIKNLKEQELDKAITIAAKRGVPILGICLGMQLLFEYSEEGMLEGLGLLKGRVVKKVPLNIDRFKVPNVGWLSVKCKKSSCLFQNINNQNLIFYFTNSYAVKNNEQSFVTSTYNFDNEYVASLEKENIYGTQFHPEKSGDVGYKLMINFLNIEQQN